MLRANDRYRMAETARLGEGGYARVERGSTAVSAVECARCVLFKVAGKRPVGVLGSGGESGGGDVGVDVSGELGECGGLFLVDLLLLFAVGA